MFTKRALIREPGHPIGQPAPMHIDCECGQKIPVRKPFEEGETCPKCGIIYDAKGWITRPIQWVEVTEKKFYDMLGCLPPASMGGGGFQVGEPMNHNDRGEPTFASFKEEGDKFYESSEALTFREFKKVFPKAEYYYQ